MQTLRRFAAVLTYPLIACWESPASGPIRRRGHRSTGGARALELKYYPLGESRRCSCSTRNELQQSWLCDYPGRRERRGPGDRINVCPGTYTEEVLISARERTTSRYARFADGKRVVKAPALMLGPTKAIVQVNGAQMSQFWPLRLVGLVASGVTPSVMVFV